MSDMILYHYWRSSCSWRVRWALNHKKIPHKLVAIDLVKAEHKSPEYLKINPAGWVPSLKWDGSIYSESLAILEGLEERFPHNPLLPSDSHSRMIVRQMALSIVAGVQPMQNLGVLNYFAGQNTAKRTEISAHFIRNGLSIFEKMLRLYAGTFSYGSQMTLADLSLVPQIYNAVRNNVDMSEFPLAHGIYKRCLEIQSCKDAAPESHVPA